MKRNSYAYLLFALSVVGTVLFVLFPPTPVPAPREVYAIAGQSNASGYAEHQQPYTSPIPAYMLSSNLQWRETYGFPISLTSHRGSVWTRVASTLTQARGYPVGFVPSAEPGTRIEQWQPGAPLYERLVTRIRAAGGVRLILWWLGETDAWIETTETDYAAALDALATALYADTGTPLLPALLQSSPLWDNTAVNAAILRVATSNSHILPPVDLRHLHTDDEHHIMSDENLQAAAEVWVEAILR